ncbi:hypothetical protein DCS_01023 [Drechmeria coniospora]|uniref:Transcription elongation factor Eaf N-terminal domain-containing protein n=1 Tax=Drechmeria coniospora TaxID=98403 RepID=A0A151GS01_DRECN|nr:hypothetical protein DCS_01023 [Drechmeria coniospora]KYK59889.1 hypothetical protein DCS_01023 [Drechmeria coniospora]
MDAFIDPTEAGKYPLIIGDGLLGKTSNEIFTGVRYNYKPTLSSTEAPGYARLKPSVPGKTSAYDLTYNDGDAKYSYNGTRSTDDNQFVLHFDPQRQAFVLDKVDSTFNMNITCLPGNSDAQKLTRQYPSLESRKLDRKNATATKEPRQKTSTSNAKAAQSKPPKRKPEKRQPPQEVALSLPQPEPAKEKKKPVGDYEEEDDDDDDDDGGLVIEFPGGEAAKHQQTDFSPAFPPPRRFDDFMDQRDSEGDADGESDDDADMEFKLPSPVNGGANHAKPVGEEGEEEYEYEEVEEQAAGADMEDDLAKEMEIAFEDLENSQAGSPDGEESEISEED